MGTAFPADGVQPFFEPGDLEAARAVAAFGDKAVIGLVAIVGWYGSRWQDALQHKSVRASDLFSFAEDDYFLSVDAEWSSDQLLGKKGLFPYSQVVVHLGLEREQQQIRRLDQAEKEQIGLFAIQKIRYVRMTRFSDYYRSREV